METQKFDFFFQKSSKFEFWLLTKNWNHLSFVNISPTLVINTSMERSSRVLQHGNIKIWFKKNRNWILTCFFLSSKLNFDLCHWDEVIQLGLNMHLYGDIGDASSSLRGSTSSFELKFFVCRHVSIWGFQNPVCLSVCPSVCLSVHLSIPREKKLPWLRQYQSYISNWYINGKVFTSTTPWKPKNLETNSKNFEIRILTCDE